MKIAEYVISFQMNNPAIKREIKTIKIISRILE